MRTVARVTFIVSFALAPAVAWTAPIKNDVSNASITCNTVISTTTIKPPLVFGGTASATSVKLKGTLAGCTVTGGSPSTPIGVTGKFKATLAGFSNDCLSLLGTTP